MNARALAVLIFIACSDEQAPARLNTQSAVTQAPTPESEVAPEVASEPVEQPVAESKAAAATPDQIAMAANDFGQPSTQVVSSLDVRRWIQDGGDLEQLAPATGNRFLVVELPEARNPSGQIFYDSRQVSLDIGGASIAVFAATTAGANAPSMGRTADGRRVFQREVYASHYAPTDDLPFAIVFEVPAGASSGTLVLGTRQVALSW